MAANTARCLGNQYKDLGTSTRKLSSGLRVETAADDAAGLAIRELMRSDISALRQGIRNANDAISAIQTADGALQVIDEKLIRMKELAEQAATGTYTSDQRMLINSEYQIMADEITRIANSTDFNGISLLNGNLDGLQALTVHFGSGNDCSEDYYSIQISAVTASSLGIGSSLTNLTSSEIAQLNGVTYFYDLTWDTGDGYYVTSPAEVKDTFAYGSTCQVYWDGSNSFWVVGQDDTGTNRVFAYQAGSPMATYIGEGGLTVTSGNPATISTQDAAQQALGIIDNAIISKDKIRASLGALENRLEATVDNLSQQAENLQAAESRISDTDVSTEMARFVRSNIVSQSAVAMLAQANNVPQMVLNLIG